MRRFDGNSHLGEIFDLTDFERQFKVTFLAKNHIFLKVQTFWNCVNELGNFRVKRLRVGKSQVQLQIFEVHEHETCLSHCQLLQLQLEIVSLKDYAAFSAF